MKVKCNSNCIHKTNDFCSKDEILIQNVSAYDEDSMQCLDYEDIPKEE